MIAIACSSRWSAGAYSVEGDGSKLVRHVLSHHQRLQLSDTAQLRHAIAVEEHVAEQLAKDRFALHEQADVMLVGHADAAVHLHPFADREIGDVRRLGLGDRDEQLGLIVASSISRAALSAAARAISISA